jgi:YD repeat-containing protein
VALQQGYVRLRGQQEQQCRADEALLDSLKREVQRSVNGTIQLTESLASAPSDNSRSIGRRILTDPRGRLTEFRTADGQEYRLSYGVDGTLVRVDAPDQMVVVDRSYQPPPDRPLPGKNVIRATALEFRDWGDDKLLSYVDEMGHRINVWPDGTSEEFDHDQGKVIRSKRPGAVTAVREGHLRSGESSGKGSGLWLVSDISPWRGTGLDKNSTLTIGADKAEQFSDSSQRFYDSSGRLSFPCSRPRTGRCCGSSPRPGESRN